MKGPTCCDVAAVVPRPPTTVFKGTGCEIGVLVPRAYRQSLARQFVDGPDKLAVHLFLFVKARQSKWSSGRQHTAKEFGCVVLRRCGDSGWLHDSGGLDARSRAIMSKRQVDQLWGKG